MGISMGGYGALLMAEKHPDVFAAVAAISPAVWTTYAEAEGANAGAYSSAADFAANDAVTHARALARIPVRIASGLSDPFHPGVVALAADLAARGRGRHRPGLPHRAVLPGPGTPVAGLPGSSPDRIDAGLTCCPEALRCRVAVRRPGCPWPPLRRAGRAAPAWPGARSVHRACPPTPGAGAARRSRPFR